jgi:hypothetical protein
MICLYTKFKFLDLKANIEYCDSKFLFFLSILIVKYEIMITEPSQNKLMIYKSHVSV